MIKVMLAKTFAASVTVADIPKKWVAVETEYGHKTLNSYHQNVVFTMNHHGNHQIEDAPAVKGIDCSIRYDNFIVSHIDLDVLFGILWASGMMPKTQIAEQLSNLVADADINGFHKVLGYIEEIPQNIKEKYLAIGYLINGWFFNDNGLAVKDISKEVHKCILRIKDIICGEVTPSMIENYTNWMNEQHKVVKQSLLGIFHLGGGDHLFSFSAGFSLTTAYVVDKLTASIIVQYNTSTRSITLSCINNETAIRLFGSNGVITPLINFFGAEAGGKCAIGGTPRNQEYHPEMLDAFIQYLMREYLNPPILKEMD